MPKTDSKDRMTIKDTANVALTAYLGVKALQFVSSATVSAISFRRARKAAKAEQ